MVDLERSGWEPDNPATVEDQLHWFINEGEVAFRSRDHEVALKWYEKVMTAARSEAWSQGGDQPDWVVYARFRRAETLALQGRSDEALPAMRSVADDYAEDPLGCLAVTLLDGYDDGSGAYAAARGVAAMQSENLYEHLYNERSGALRFPMNASGILYPGAGLVAYLEAHPLPMNDTEELLAGLREIGFAAEDVQHERIGMTYTEMTITLKLPDVPNGGERVVLWTLGGYSGH